VINDRLLEKQTAFFCEGLLFENWEVKKTRFQSILLLIIVIIYNIHPKNISKNQY
jgi:hypothetical protein